MDYAFGDVSRTDALKRAIKYAFENEQNRIIALIDKRIKTWIERNDGTYDAKEWLYCKSRINELQALKKQIKEA